jgi:hypothetical protein
MPDYGDIKLGMVRKIAAEKNAQFAHDILSLYNKRLSPARRELQIQCDPRARLSEEAKLTGGRVHDPRGVIS